MNDPTQPPPLPVSGQRPPEPTGGDKLKKLLAPLGAAGVLLLKYATALFKFLPVILKTGGTMILSIWAYSLRWGFWFAVGFVLLILVHECGHLLAARKCGLKVGAPVFIPFMGAIIALKEAPRNAWIEAQVGIGGPLLGTLGAAVCEGIFLITGNPMFRGLAHIGFLLNLFNLAPVGFLDGGRIVTALSPWLWLVGYAIMVTFAVTIWMAGQHLNFVLILILLFSLPRLFSLFRKKTDEEKRYFEVTPAQRWTMAALYFGLIAFLVIGMHQTYIPPETLQGR